VNDEDFEMNTAPHRTLLEVLRDELGFTGTKEGCGTGDCGACTVIVDGRAVTSCLILAPEAEGRQITTIEGLSSNGRLHPIQQAFVDLAAAQCGYCTPGLIMSIKALLDVNPNPSLEDVRLGIAGNLCRCTGYAKIYQAIDAAAEALRR
jgi:carbon-monoxide dehydrogenase small subunit